jgi:hypothetical protein
MDLIISRKPVKNKKGEIISRTITLKNKAQPENGLSFKIVNKFYEKLIAKLIAKGKYKPDNILITAKDLDNRFITLKSSYRKDKSLKYLCDSLHTYIDLNPFKKKQYLGNYYEVNITIQTY